MVQPTKSDGSESTSKKILRKLSGSSMVNKVSGVSQTANKSNENEEKPSLHQRVNNLKFPGGIDISNAVESLMAANPKYVNRLSGLFKELTKKNIEVTRQLIDLISVNITYVNQFINLVNFMHSRALDFNKINAESLFNASSAAETVLNGCHALVNHNLLTLDTFKLMLVFPEHALVLSQLISDLDEYSSISSELMEKKLSQFSKKFAGSAFDFFNFTLEHEVFYPELIDLILKHQEHIDTILEGAKKLRANKSLLTSFYFEMVEKRPENAINFAKNLALLNSASLIDLKDKQALELVNQFGAGEFMFFKILKKSGGLTPETYQSICQNHMIFSRKDIQDALNNVPLFSIFNDHELNKLMTIIAKGNGCPTKEEINKFIEIIDTHQLGTLTNDSEEEPSPHRLI